MLDNHIKYIDVRDCNAAKYVKEQGTAWLTITTQNDLTQQVKWYSFQSARDLTLKPVLISTWIKTEIRHLESRSPGSLLSQPNAGIHLLLALELQSILWWQSFPVASAVCPFLASHLSLHPKLSGSLWSTGWGDWERKRCLPPAQKYEKGQQRKVKRSY